MSSSTSPSAEMNFAPLDLVTTKVLGQLSANIYPWKPGQPTHEHHSFHVNMNTLTLLPINASLILDALCPSLNCSAIAKGLMFDWCNLHHTRWFDFANLSILSFHNSAGRKIINMTITGKPTTPLPMKNGPTAACQQQDVCFVRVTCKVDFAPLLITMPDYCTLTMCKGCLH